MTPKVLITGATDGIGFAAAERFARDGWSVVVHGRDRASVEVARSSLSLRTGSRLISGVHADLSRLSEVEALAADVAAAHPRLDVLINNAGVYRVDASRTADGLDARFAVNAIAPYLLTRRLLPRIATQGRVLNVASAAQSRVSFSALHGRASLSDAEAYAQSKLALVMWTRALADVLGDRGPTLVAVNPGSLLGTKLAKDAYGVTGDDVGIGAQALRVAADDDAFADAAGKYYDNDTRRFAPPHADANKPDACAEVLAEIERAIVQVGRSGRGTMPSGGHHAA